MTQKEISTAFFSMMDSVLKPIGFVKTKKEDGWSYVRSTASGYNQVVLLVWAYGDISYVSLAFMVRMSDLNKVYNPFSSAVPEVYEENSTISAVFKCEGCDDQKRIKIETPDDLKKAVDTWAGVIRKEGFSFFETFTTVEAFDKELNRENRERDLYMSEIRYRPIVGLVAAALNKNKDFLKWENYYRQVLQRAPETVRNNYESLVRLLKEKYIE